MSNLVTKGLTPEQQTIITLGLGGVGQIIVIIPSGGCECGSSAEAYRVFSEIPAGGCECDSAVESTEIFNPILTGGCECDSAVEASCVFVETPSGGCECNGSVGGNIYVEIPSGGCECSGSVVPAIIPATPPTQPHDRYSLGVTFGVPGYTKRKRKNIKIKFTFAENTYDYEKEFGDASIILKGLGPEKSTNNNKRPLVMLETIKAGNGQNYNL